jgi:hypothetical protein
MRRRVPGLALTALLALLVLAVAHDLVFLLTYGSGYAAELARTGHGSRWDGTVRVVLAAGLALAAVATMRLGFLWGLVRAAKAGPQPVGLPVRAYLGIVSNLWIRLFVVAMPFFVVQENFERWSVGVALPGLGVLASSGTVGPIPVFLLVSLAIAAVASLFRWGIATLEARVEAARTLWPAPSARRAYSASVSSDLPSASILGRNLAGRAPPSPLPA